MTEFEFGFDLDAAQERDEEAYLNKKKSNTIYNSKRKY